MSLFTSFKDVYDKVFSTEAVNIDNIIFKLHYRVTVTALVIFSVVLSLGQVSIKHYEWNFLKNSAAVCSTTKILQTEKVEKHIR